jgi:thiol-disulfide isomerase/thioredoxin
VSPVSRHFALFGAVIAIIAAIAVLESQRAKPNVALEPATPIAAASVPVRPGGPQYRELAGISATINAPADFAIAPLIGKKIVLVDFWTYSCINCQRTTPYLNAWYDKYRDQGLEIVGVHTPEFGFEKSLPNVQAAVEKFGIKYPVVLDNDYATWTAYANRYWPRKYLVDLDGTIVYDHIGEGGYEETEKKIQELLAERAKRLGEEMSVASDMAAPVAIAPPEERVSPETYFGASRNAATTGNAVASTTGEQTLALPAELSRDRAYLAGTWRFSEESASPAKGGALVYKLHAKRVYLVAGTAADKPVRVRVLLDGKAVAPGKLGGADVAANGVVTLGDDRLYHLLELPEYGDHELRIEAVDEGAVLFTFTFG